MPSKLRERPVPDAATLRSRRAFARRQWARRWLTWKYVLAGLLLVALVAGGAWLLWFSSVLAVKQVEVSGAGTLGADQVRAVAAVPEGEALASVDLTAVQARVQALADVRSAQVTRHWPDTVTIDVVERTPVAVVEIGGRLRGLDVEGVVFRDYRTAPDGLPRVETPADTGRDALQEAAGVISALPGDIADKVDHVEVATVDQISLELRDGRTVIWGSADESDLKAEVLDALLPQEGSTYDVSVPGQPAVRP
ncbi:cell division protein FtsQ/DivIB [Nocardioides euryhalodurans]|uniref:cell division protein FtsQ/DivIB n=1 Tax=Nocardioides euryhalodurans TaxID=2518370 RepID=UPI001FC9C380|nr:FtsQ-type POTRA domain-containing protein [Nocardioides euryhalodurans]